MGVRDAWPSTVDKVMYTAVNLQGKANKERYVLLAQEKHLLHFLLYFLSFILHLICNYSRTELLD